MSNGDSMVRCEGLTKAYGQIVALENLNLSIPRGCVFGYIGHNGAGKTTTIRILAGLLKATSGKAEVAGVQVGACPNRLKALVGYMPDSFGVYDQMRVWEYLDFFGAAQKIPPGLRRQRIDYVLDLAGAEYMRDRFVDSLSHGMKQRVGIARTLLHDPQVLLLDEPANGLDPDARIQMRKLIRKLADSGKTLLVSSHILPELAAVCDAVGIMHKGRLKACGPIQEVLSRIRHDRLMEMKAAAGLEAAEKFLAQQPSCRGVNSAEAGVVSFRFNGDDAALSALLRSLVTGGVRVVTLREVPLSLEEAYMAISGIGSDAPGDEQEEKGQDAKA